MARKQRLDVVLVERGLATSRQQAQQWIRAGRVRSLGQVLDKPGQATAADLPLEVDQPPQFVSRGGEKLVAALDALPIRVAGRVCLDGGISTGGFSDCLLQRGASRVYGIDVGYGQTAWSLRTDPRLVLRERTNLRHLSPDDLYGPEDPWPDLAVADLSFISLGLVLPALGALLAPDQREALLLVKPQFEVGRSRVGKGGVVRDPAAHVQAIEGVIRAAAALGWQALGLVASPITGPAGNHEYLLWLGSTLAVEGASAAAAGVESAISASDALERLERATAGLETADSGDGATEPADNETAENKSGGSNSGSTKSVPSKSGVNKTAVGLESQEPVAPVAGPPDPHGPLTEAPEPGTAPGEAPHADSSQTWTPQTAASQTASSQTSSQGATPWQVTPSQATSSQADPNQSAPAETQRSEPMQVSSRSHGRACLASNGGLDRRAIRALVDQTLASP